MRLEERDDPAGVSLQGAQRGGALFRVVAEIVDNGDFRGACADHIEPSGEASIARQCLDRIGNCYTGGYSGGYRSKRIRQVVKARNGKLQRVVRAIAAIDHRRTNGKGLFGNRSFDHADFGSRIAHRKTEPWGIFGRQSSGLGIVQIDHPDIADPQEITEQRAQFLH